MTPEEVRKDIPSGVSNDGVYEYTGEVNKFGGASEQEQAAQASEASFNTELQGQYATRFNDQQEILQQLTNALSPIVAAGPNQLGYSAPELAALNTEAVSGVGANYANAERAVKSIYFEPQSRIQVRQRERLCFSFQRTKLMSENYEHDYHEDEHGTIVHTPQKSNMPDAEKAAIQLIQTPPRQFARTPYALAWKARN